MNVYDWCMNIYDRFISILLFNESACLCVCMHVCMCVYIYRERELTRTLSHILCVHARIWHAGTTLVAGMIAAIAIICMISIILCASTVYTHVTYKRHTKTSESWVASGKPICQLLRCSGLTLTHQNASSWLLAFNVQVPSNPRYPLTVDKIYMSNFVWSYSKTDQTRIYSIRNTSKQLPNGAMAISESQDLDHQHAELLGFRLELISYCTGSWLLHVTSIRGFSAFSAHISKGHHQTSRMSNHPLVLRASFVGTANDFPALEWRHGSLSSKQGVCSGNVNLVSACFDRVYILKYP